MQLFKKFKLNYNIKLFQNYLLNKNFEDAHQFLIDLKNKSHPDYFSFLNNCLDEFADLPESFFEKKIIWLVSYDLEDLSLIKNFFKDYIQKNSIKNFVNSDYSLSLSDYYTKYQINEKKDQLVFNDFVIHSELFQNLLLLDCNQDYLILNSCSAFFETSQNKYFMNPNKTFCYFYILPDPENLYSRYKKNYRTPEPSFNHLFNFNNEEFLNPELKDQKFKVYENRTNLNVNVKSWTGENVLSSYKGKIIPYKKLVDRPEEVLLETIYHLRQYGLDININIPEIHSFLRNNPVHKNNFELSNNEKKFLSKNLENDVKNLIEYN